MGGEKNFSRPTAAECVSIQHVIHNLCTIDQRSQLIKSSVSSISLRLPFFPLRRALFAVRSHSTNTCSAFSPFVNFFVPFGVPVTPIRLDLYLFSRNARLFTGSDWEKERKKDLWLYESISSNSKRFLPIHPPKRFIFDFNINVIWCRKQIQCWRKYFHDFAHCFVHAHHTHTHVWWECERKWKARKIHQNE